MKAIYYITTFFILCILVSALCVYIHKHSYNEGHADGTYDGALFMRRMIMDSINESHTSKTEGIILENVHTRGTPKWSERFKFPNMPDTVK